jgi:hypothetical protein
MLVVVLGLPVPRVLKMLSEVAAIVGAANGPVEVVEAADLAGLTRHAASARAAHIIALVTQADRDWVVVLAACNVPFAYVHADPMPFVLAHESSLDGARAALMKLASFVEPQANPRCLTIDAAAPGAAEALLRMVAGRLGMDPPFPGMAPAVGGNDTSEPLSTLDGELDATVRAVLRSFAGLGRGERPQSILTSRLLFLDATRGAIPVSGPIDATGRPGVLFYGPRTCLPRGKWRARAVVAFSQHLVGHTFGIEVTTGGGSTRLGEAAFSIDAPGRHDMMIPFENPDPDAPIELRLSSKRGVFDGTLSLGYVEFAAIEEALGEGEALEKPTVALPGSASPAPRI